MIHTRGIQVKKETFTSCGRKNNSFENFEKLRKSREKFNFF